MVHVPLERPRPLTFLSGLRGGGGEDRRVQRREAARLRRAAAPRRRHRFGALCFGDIEAREELERSPFLGALFEGFVAAAGSHRRHRDAGNFAV